MFIAVADLKLSFDRPENNLDTVEEIAQGLTARFGVEGAAPDFRVESMNPKFLVFFVRFEAPDGTDLMPVREWLIENGFTRFEINPPFR
jgi:hypothetical protein